MSGWKRISPRRAFKERAFWLHHGLILAQVFVIVAYFLPWRQSIDGTIYDEGLLEWIHIRLTHNPSMSQVYLSVSLIVCLGMAIISSLFTLVSFVKKERRASAMRASSMLNSIAFVGPVLYLHRFLPQSGSGWTELSHSIDGVGGGWFIALVCGLTASLLSLCLYRDACKCGDVDCNSKELGHNLSSVTRFFIAPVFMIVTILGFFLPWSCGSMTSWWAQVSWSVSGFEVSILMYVVPSASVLFLTSSMIGDIIGKVDSRVFSQAAHNLVAFAFALTLTWGLAFGEYRSMIPDAYRIASLQLGWYLCTSGLLSMLVIALVSCKPGSQDTEESPNSFDDDSV